MEIYFERASWMWGLSLVVATISIQAIGMVMMALGMVRIRSRLEDRHLGLWYVVPTLTCVIATSGWLLTALHGIEAAIWAAAYVWLGALGSPIEAMLYSVDSMTTRGASGLVLHGHWQMLGALEAANGTLLFGISTAYIFGVMQFYWPMLHRTQPLSSRPAAPTSVIAP